MEAIDLAARDRQCRGGGHCETATGPGANGDIRTPACQFTQAVAYAIYLRGYEGASIPTRWRRAAACVFPRIQTGPVYCMVHRREPCEHTAHHPRTLSLGPGGKVREGEGMDRLMALGGRNYSRPAAARPPSPLSKYASRSGADRLELRGGRTWDRHLRTALLVLIMGTSQPSPGGHAMGHGPASFPRRPRA